MRRPGERWITTHDQEEAGALESLRRYLSVRLELWAFFRVDSLPAMHSVLRPRRYYAGLRRSTRSFEGLRFKAFRHRLLAELDDVGAPPPSSLTSRAGTAIASASLACSTPHGITAQVTSGLMLPEVPSYSCSTPHGITAPGHAGWA